MDFAMGHYIAGAYPQTQESKGPKNWVAFCKRPLKHKIIRGSFDTVEDTLSAIEKAKQDSKAAGNVHYNPVNLPIITYSRGRPVTPSDPDAASIQDRKVMETLTVDENEIDRVAQFLKMQFIQVDLDYKVTFLAYDTLTLDQMQLNWLFYCVAYSRIKYSCEIDGEKIDLIGTIVDSKTPAFEDISLPSSANRVYAISFNLTLRTYVANGYRVEVKDPISLEFIQGQHIR